MSEQLLHERLNTCFPVYFQIYSEEKIIEKEGGTIAEEASVEGQLLEKKGRELGRKGKTKKQLQGRAILSFKTPN